jgi:PAS domain-containing protein
MQLVQLRGGDLAGTSRIPYQTNVRIVRLMCSGAVDPVFVLNPSGMIEATNPAAAGFTGYSEEETLGLTRYPEGR